MPLPHLVSGVVTAPSLHWSVAVCSNSSENGLSGVHSATLLHRYICNGELPLNVPRESEGWGAVVAPREEGGHGGMSWRNEGSGGRH